MVEKKASKTGQMSPWAAAALVVIAGTSLGIIAGYLLTRSQSQEDAVAKAFATIVADSKFWESVRDSGYSAKLRPELSTGRRARIDLRCVRQDVQCAPAPQRTDAEFVVLTD